MSLLKGFSVRGKLLVVSGLSPERVFDRLSARPARRMPHAHASCAAHERARARSRIMHL